MKKNDALDPINEARKLPPGQESQAFRIAAPADVLAAFEELTPLERGHFVKEALKEAGLVIPF